MFGNERADRRMCGRPLRDKKVRTSKRETKQDTRREAKLPLHSYVRYRDCLANRAATPKDPAEKLLFQFLMVFGMVSIMATFNGVRHSGLNFFITYHWIYPLVACVALFLRLALTSKIVDFLAPRLVYKHFEGFASICALAALNIVIMTPLLNSLVTMCLYGPHDLLFNIANNLPVAMVAAFLTNVFIVAPTVKMIYNNYLTTARGMRWLNFVERTAMPWMYLINS